MEQQREKTQAQATPPPKMPQTAPEFSKSESDAAPESGEKPAETEAVPLIQSVYSLIESGDFKNALLVLEQLLEKSPGNLQAMLLKVQILLFFRKLRDADKTASRVIELYSGDHHVYLAKAMSTLLYTNDIKGAIQYLDKGLKLKQDCIELVLAKAQMLYLINDPAYNSWILQASEIDPSRTDTFLKKYWIEKLPEPPSNTGAELHGLVQTLMFLASQQAFGGWK